MKRAALLVLVALVVAGAGFGLGWALHRPATRVSAPSTREPTPYADLASYDGGPFVENLTFSFPWSWHLLHHDVRSNFTDTFAFLSAQPMGPPCVSTGTATICAGPVRSLRPGNFLAEWTTFTSLGGDGFFNSRPGQRLTLGGRPAVIDLTMPTGCASMRGTDGLSAVIRSARRAIDFYTFFACLRGPDVEPLKAQLIAVLQSVTFKP